MDPHDDPYRPHYHFSAPANWLNDPNGLVYYRGEYHLFYQYHPESAVWGPMHWGHAVSRDLVNWQHLPVALYPDEIGTIYSGSAVIDWQNSAGFGKEAIVAIFTHHQPQTEMQSLAYSTDAGRTWSKYAGNPVLAPTPPLRDFRDPKVFWYAHNGAGHWVLALAAGDEIRFFRSPDLRHWQLTGSFGKQYSEGYCPLETPDLFELPVDGGAETRWVLTWGVGHGGPAGKSAMRYFVGSFDGETFTPQAPQAPALWLDFGADYYAGQSWSDAPNGRRLMLGWQNNWQYAHSVPTGSWRGMFGLPRELSLRHTPPGLRLFQQPVPELARLRGQRWHWQNLTLTPGSNPLAGLSGAAFEMVAELQPPPAAGFGFNLRVGGAEKTTVGYLPEQGQVFIDRTLSGDSSFHPDFARRHCAPLAPAGGLIRLHIFVDTCSVEVFANNGQVALADSIFPSPHSLGLELFVEDGELRVNELEVYALAPANFTG